jgi:hypothetical protein
LYEDNPFHLAKSQAPYSKRFESKEKFEKMSKEEKEFYAKYHDQEEFMDLLKKIVNMKRDPNLNSK